jgi:hypothetical protein
MTKMNLRETPEWLDLFRQLIALQNGGDHDNQDLISITGFFSSIEELKNHVTANTKP